MNETLSIQQVLHAERSRAAAVVARDLVALQELVHDELVYVHATGVRHHKAEWLDYVGSGPVFLALDFDAQEAHEGEASVLLHGELRLRLRRPGEAADVSALSWASALWLRNGQGRWQLRLLQSTRLPA